MPDHSSALEGLEVADILASTVHDAKNSIGLLSNQLDSLAKELQDRDPEVAKRLHEMQEESSRTSVGLSHMLGVYRIDNQLIHPSLDEVLVLDVLEDAAMRYASTLEHRNIRVELDCEDEDTTWFMDPIMIDQVLTSIMTNSIRYTRNWIGLSARLVDDELCIAVEDNGDGFPESLLNCMEPDASLRVKTSSTGLGLYFARGIAYLHHNSDTGKHGRIEMVNKPEGGARFTLWLP